MTRRQVELARKVCSRMPKEQADELWLRLRDCSSRQAYKELERYLPAKMPDDAIMEMDAGDHY